MKKLLWLIAGLVLLAACSQPSTTSNDTGSGNEKATVTVSVAFPRSQSGSFNLTGLLKPLGVPEGAYGATITITPVGGGQPITTTVDRNNPTKTVTLTTGQYNFEASVYPTTEQTEIAWGKKENVDISGNTEVSIDVTTIIRSVALVASGAPLQQFDKAQVQLLVSASAALDWSPLMRVPPGDYSVAWSVSGADDSISGNMLGAEVVWGGSSNPIVVTAEVTGLDENHQQTTITASTNIYPFQAAGNGFTLNGLLSEWNGSTDISIVPMASVFSPSSSAVAQPAAIASDGSFSLNYYSGSEMQNARDAMGQLESMFEAICVSNQNWTDEPDAAVFTAQSQFKLLDANGEEAGSAWIGLENGGAQQLTFWYVDRDVSIEGSCINPDGNQYEFDLQLNAGWNEVRQGFEGSSYVINGTPIDNTNVYTIPSGYKWMYYIDQPHVDYGIEVSQDIYNPAEGSSVDVVFTVYNNSDSDTTSVTVALTPDNGLTISSIDGADSVDQNSFTVSVDPGLSRDVTVTVAVDAGTAGNNLTLNAQLNMPAPDDDPSNDSVTVVFNPVASGQSASVGIALDFNPPAVYFSQPEYYENINISSSPYNIVINATDQEGSITDIELYQGYQLLGTLQDGGIASASNTDVYEYSWAVESLAAGQYELTAIAYDSAHNSAVTSVIVTLQ